jgi:hypothetical protein
VAHVVTGVLVVAGVAALAWALLSSRRDGVRVDPLTEADRRINALEDSLRHLHDTFGQAINA